MTTSLPQSTPAVRYLPTTTAYDLWAEVYDTDGNFLQALDTIEMKALLPKFLSLLPSPSEDSHSRKLKLVDLGCGTGRNTSALLTIPSLEIVGLDASPKMLDVARSRLLIRAGGSRTGPMNIEFAVYDLLSNPSPPQAAINADGLISTLVLEHVPILNFFHSVSTMLKPNGVLLLTNMHSEMGAISQAGFVDPNTGEKIRPKSYAHTVSEVLTEAQKSGFEVVGEVLERSVDEQTSEMLGARSKKWIGVTVWFGIILRKTG